MSVFRLGLQIPTFQYRDTRAAQLLDRLTEIANVAESAGFDAVFSMDHLHQVMGQPTDWLLDGSTMLAALSARTSRVGLGMMVGGVTYRNPAQLAKMTTTLDVLSGGRAILGIGAGWHEAEHHSYGIEFPPMAERLERLEEALQVLRSMFTNTVTTFEGTRYRVWEAINSPQPIRGDIPIVVGGTGRKLLRLVARYADASNMIAGPDVASIRELVEVIGEHCVAIGRDPKEVSKTRTALLVTAKTRGQAREKLAAFKRLTGRTDEQLRSLAIVDSLSGIADQVSTMLEAGLDGFMFLLPEPDDLNTLQSVGGALGPLLAP